MLFTIGLALVLLALIGWGVQALRFPGRRLSALLQSNRNRPSSKGK
jgi:hypothetical protein